MDREKRQGVPQDPIAAAAGSLKGRLPPIEVIRAQAREDERIAIERRERELPAPKARPR
jgi:hypothetical protein